MRRIKMAIGSPVARQIDPFGHCMEGQAGP